MQRKNLVAQMKERGAISTKSIERAFLEIPRHKFFPEEIVQSAYDDNAFPIGFGQTISQPSTIAAMLETLRPKTGMKVLEIGSGTGYVVALLSKIVGAKGKVYGIDIIPELVQRAEETLSTLGIKNFELKQDDGNSGWREKSPFDRILVSCGCRNVPGALFEQLAEKGFLLAPIGGQGLEELILFEKVKGEILEREKQGWFSFVPMQGKAQQPKEQQEDWKGVT